ncbi:MAG TPA: hypothetical protein VGR56_05290, partial [Nitrososphaerales archaeon]|nr:hypothetical protein [Nitrososphaerales archaeon]
TIQAENLGTLVEPGTGAGSPEVERLVELAKSASAIFISDFAPTTVELLRAMTPAIGESQALGLYSAAPKRIEGSIPELKGRVATLPPPVPSPEDQGPVFVQQLSQTGTKLILGTAKPDPLFGIVDAKVQACLNWVARSHGVAAQARKGMEPEPFQKTEAYEEIERIAKGIEDAHFLSAVPRGGKVRTVMENAPFDAIKNSFVKTSVQPTRGMIVGAGGRGFDDTLSAAIRGVWNVLPGIRRTGSVLLIAECSEGIGSTALEMLVTGRLSGVGERKREKYVEGLEEVFYLSKLKEEYDIMLLSGMPETYAGTKLGLTTARGSGEAVGRMLNKVGRSGKLNVVPRAPECFVESA